MNNVPYLNNLIAEQKNQGIPLDLVAWNAACACVGWPYVYGAVGEECKPAKRAQYGTKFYPDGHTTIVTKCKAISWDNASKSVKVTGNCSGCQWNLPVLMFDCRGLTRKILAMVYNFTLWGGTVAGQWNDDRNWKAKGEIGTMPRDTLCCLFVYKNGKWQHTGFGYNDQTVEASSGVQYFKRRNSKWTHWAVPKCVDSYQPAPIPEGYAVVTGTRVALRKDPSTKAEIITRIETGSKVKLEPAPKEWDYVSFGSKTGWMMRAYIREEGEFATVTGKRVALRKEPSTKATIITRINTGEKVKLEAEPPLEWDYVSYNGKAGWMMKEFLKEG